MLYEDFGIFQKEIKELKAAGLLDFEEGRVECLNPELDVGEQADLLPYNRDKWEFPRDKLKLGNILSNCSSILIIRRLLPLKLVKTITL